MYQTLKDKIDTCLVKQRHIDNWSHKTNKIIFCETNEVKGLFAIRNDARPGPLHFCGNDKFYNSTMNFHDYGHNFTALTMTCHWMSWRWRGSCISISLWCSTVVAAVDCGWGWIDWPCYLCRSSLACDPTLPSSVDNSRACWHFHLVCNYFPAWAALGMGWCGGEILGQSLCHGCRVILECKMGRDFCCDFGMQNGDWLWLALFSPRMCNVEFPATHEYCMAGAIHFGGHGKRGVIAKAWSLQESHRWYGDIHNLHLVQ